MAAAQLEVARRKIEVKFELQTTRNRSDHQGEVLL
jgi:hypothetical protein